MNNKPLFPKILQLHYKIKAIYILSCLLLISTNVFSQKKEIKILNETKVFGKNHINNSDIEGIECTFQERIYDWFVDTTNHFLTLQLKKGNVDINARKGKGRILQYDLKNKKILWTKPVDYEIHELLKFDNLLIFNEYNDAYGLDAHTGEYLWKVMNFIYIAHPKYNVGVAYRFNEVDGIYTNEFLGFNLWKGIPIWSRTISREYGWNDYSYLNDSTLLVTASGLHAININTGKGWDYNTLTGKNKYAPQYDAGKIAGAVVGAVVAGIIGGLLGYTVIPVVNYNALLTAEHIIRDVSSNTLIDNDFIYFASAEQLVMLDKTNGNIIWEHTFKEDKASNSYLFIKDNVLYMINKGFAWQGRDQISYGATFIAAYDKKTGMELYHLVLKNEHGFIVDFKLIDNELYLLFQHVIGKYDIEDGTVIVEKKFPKKEFGKLLNFVDNNVFISNQSEYLLRIDQYDLADLHVYSTLNEIISLDSEANATNITGCNYSWVHYLDYKDYKFISNEATTLILNKDGKEIANLKVSSRAFIFDDILYDKRDNSFIAIDLRNIIKE
ncbi:MAG: PQQ-binding-like beta-propeller repeat protein [Lentimicrobiaceae bacterium]|nr:PQQ-binding-like beta-propeller repeat protein [Lentimicrobiaceae bacterium]